MTTAFFFCLLGGLPLADRPATAPGAAALAKSLEAASLLDRETRLVDEILSGNVPTYWRKFVPIRIERDGRVLEVEVAPDYLSVGSDADYRLMPLSPWAAQRIADRLDCVLPTPRLVDAIAKASTVRLAPEPIPPSPAMTTLPVFLDHDVRIKRRRAGKSLELLTSGHKKDVVLSAKAAARAGKVAIYGWHRLDGRPIQPLYLGHAATWVDYSHGVRLVKRAATLDGKPTTIDAVLADPATCGLLSDEGPIKPARYEVRPWPWETREELKLEPGVRVVIQRAEPIPKAPTLLVFYALPNGNTVEWTAGRQTRPGDDWHFDVQHIDAQTRFLRERIKGRNLVVAYLENDLKAWPAWRRKHGDARIPEILEAVRGKFDKPTTHIALNGHSGGGSLIFGYLNTLETIPAEVERIAFLDSNYAYETERHRDKLVAWLKSPDHRLCILAYHDAIALLNGKTFVSERGGTWGRSKAMREDLGVIYPLVETRVGNRLDLRGLDGRIQFHLLENPDRKILHTVQVERNGFIESMLSGTSGQGVGYEYFGRRAYSSYIDEPVFEPTPALPGR